jgi:hypothetical protein
MFVAGIVAGSLALAGCATARSASPSASARLDEAALAAVAKDGSYASDEVVLHRAGEELIRTCMAARGQRYVIHPYEPASMNSLTDDEAHPDLTWRRSVGYALRGAVTGQGRGQNDRHLATLSPAQQAEWQRALKGDGTKMWSLHVPSGRTFTSPLNGCIADSGRRLYGSPQEATRVLYYLQDMQIRIGMSVRGDARYTAAVARWAQCMRGRGYAYPTPTAARQAISTQYQRDAATSGLPPLEIRVAVADADCVAEAGLTSTANSLAKNRAAALPVELRRELNAVTSARLRGIDQAKKILSGAPLDR